ncbi:MAG: hypothetical protein M1497_09905 [Nitrospirae bacterium]|nr:hypothetical protein [Nitrospirota bacterium]
MNEVFKYIDDNRSLFIEDLRRLIKQPSVSTTGYGIKECARLLKQRMEKTGIRSRVIKTGLHPVVYGEIGTFIKGIKFAAAAIVSYAEQ